jgi:coenzyme F420-reducing hydrogenase beta subunit
LSHRAHEILHDGGVVFGAAYDDAYRVHHIYIENESDMRILQGSKYVQSDIGDTYNEALKVLKQGRKVFFTGTACQIAGLKQFLGRDYDNLLQMCCVMGLLLQSCGKCI